MQRIPRKRSGQKRLILRNIKEFKEIKDPTAIGVVSENKKGIESRLLGIKETDEIETS